MNKFLKVLFFPLTIVFMGLVYIYKFFISPILPKTCRFTPSCSSYMLIALKEYGPFKGIILGTKRLLRCSPGHKGGFDPVPTNIKGDIRWIL